MAITPVDRELTRLLSEGQAAAKRGDKAMARALLTQLVEKEPRHEEAWMWLSGVVTDPFEQQICLENALVINPANAQARKGLEYIAARTGAQPSALETAAGAAQAPDAQAVMGTPSVMASPFGDSAPFGQAALPSDGVPPWAVGDPEFQPDLPQTEQPPVQAVAELPGATPLYAAAMVSNEPAGMDGADMGLPADAQPFVVPDGKSSANGADDGIPDWLGNLTPTVQIAEEPQYPQTYAPFNHAEFAVPAPTTAAPTTMVSDLPDAMMGAMGAGALSSADAAQTHIDPALAAQQAPQTPFLEDAPPDLGPMGPYTELQMPAPDQLPGVGPIYAPPAEAHTEAQPSEQPWYLQRTTGNMPPMPDNDAMPNAHQAQVAVDDGGKRTAMMVGCPNCRESVPDTSLACPNCRYSFFVNCPFCHELVDTSDGRPGVSEPCPYCQNSITKMDMGLGTVNEYASQKMPGSRPGVPHSDPKHAFPSMNQQLIEGPVVERRPAMAWVVDLMWLVAVIVMVWALTQLPTWLNLSGQY